MARSVWAVKVSSIREEIIGQLPGDMAVMHDSMERVEHSVEALVPFLQYQDRDTEIISTCFEGELTGERIARFFAYTVHPDDFREYRWTWCGRYSIPFGLLTSLYLQSLQESNPLTGIPVGYATSISQPNMIVTDLGMGRTAIATPRHWVGYPAIGFK